MKIIEIEIRAGSPGTMGDAPDGARAFAPGCRSTKFSARLQSDERSL
jgi:hypothetical protein